MYSINGVPLDNDTFGWSLRAPSKPLAGIVKQVQALRGNRHGVRAVPSDFDAISLTLVVRTPRANLATLYALLTAPTVTLTLTADSSRQAVVELLSASPEGYGDADAWVDVTFIVRVPGVFWRTAEVTSAATTLSTGSVGVSVLSGISAPVSDAIVRVRGQFAGLLVTDSGGSWFSFPSVAAGSYLRFHSDTGLAFVTTTDTWTGGTQVSGQVDFGGPRGRFEIVPRFPTASDPSVRDGRLTVATSSRASAQVQVRARGAHLA